MEHDEIQSGPNNSPNTSQRPEASYSSGLVAKEPKHRSGSRAHDKGPEQRSKRQKIALACEECRARKVRCDGVRPVCGACRKRRGQPRNCIVQDDRGPILVSSVYIEQLQNRIRHLESNEQNAGLSLNRVNDNPIASKASHNTEQLPLTSLIPAGHQNKEGAQRQGVVYNTADSSPVSDKPGYNSRAPVSFDSQQNAPTRRTSKTTKSVEYNTSHHEIMTPSHVTSTTSNLGSLKNDGKVISDSASMTLETDYGVDGMGSVGNTAHGPINQGSYGSSSTASFMKQVRDAVEGKTQSSSQPYATQIPYQNLVVSPVEELYSQQMKKAIAQDLVLPSRRISNLMMNIYWEQVHILYPFLEKTSFNREYEALWTGEQSISNEPMTFCILNMVFAITSQISGGAEVDNREVSVETFFARSLQLLRLDILGSGSLQLVQALLLTGQFLQSTESPQRCWVVVGSAIRIAQGMGLHLPDTSARLDHQRDRELSRRIWHGCILMDRIMSMTFGRPLMVPRALSLSVPYPANIDDEYLAIEPSVEGAQPSGKPSKIEFFVCTLKLYSILEEVLTTFYNSGTSDELVPKKDVSSTGNVQEMDYNSVLRLDRALISWHGSLPSYLLRNSSPLESKSTGPFLRQANILQLRFLHLQILLFRPVLSGLLSAAQDGVTVLSHATGPSLAHATALPCAHKCVLAAQSVIDIITEHQQNDGAVEALPAWWYKVFSATVLIAARIYRPLHREISDKFLKRSWRQCLTLLQNLSHMSKSARRCLAALEFLDEKVIPQLQNDAQVAETDEMMFSPQPLPVQRPPEDATQFLMDSSTMMDDSLYDVTWLQSVPFDLLQYDSTDAFRGTFGQAEFI